MIVNYLQIDPKWKNMDYSAKGESTTIGKAGCGITCAAMVIASWANKNVTPITTRDWSLSHGYKAKNQGTYYTYFVPQMQEYGLKCYRVNTSSVYKNSNSSAHKTVEDAIAKGHLVIACMGKGHWTSSGHYVLLYNILGGYAYINDPNSTNADRTKNTFAKFKNEVKYYWVIEKPIPKNDKPIVKVEEDDMTRQEVIDIVREILAGEGTAVSDYFKKEIAKAKAEGITDGSRPQGYAKREEVAAMIVRSQK